MHIFHNWKYDINFKLRYRVNAESRGTSIIRIRTCSVCKRHEIIDNSDTFGDDMNGEYPVGITHVPFGMRWFWMRWNNLEERYFKRELKRAKGLIKDIKKYANYRGRP